VCSSNPTTPRHWTAPVQTSQDAAASDPVYRVRQSLARARSLNAALAALSMADTPMLREIEADYTFRAGPADTLRERIAAAHLLSLAGRGNPMGDTGHVTTDLVRQWAHDTLVEWMDGYTDYVKESGGQYRLRPVPGQHLGADAADERVTIEVATTAGADRRHFQIRVEVTEVS